MLSITDQKAAKRAKRAEKAKKKMEEDHEHHLHSFETRYSTIRDTPTDVEEVCLGHIITPYRANSCSRCGLQAAIAVRVLHL